MSPKQEQKRASDPVNPEQGGRMTASDPLDTRSAPREEVVRKKAYEIYERRGRTDGRAQEDWFEAESHCK